MLKTALRRYINNFKGFRREVWILALITFINRAGTMVLPFLSKYLKENLHFTYGQVGWIMVSFGIGSMLGSWLGGKLSDKIGFYKIMVFSLFTSGILFFVLQYITTFWGLCFGVFAIMSVSDMFRPAMFVSLGVYAKPENRVRALSLIRLAINFGFAAGPMLGGLIILGIGYKGLFWIDGSTCILAILIFAFLVKEKKKIPELHQTSSEPVVVKSIFKDKPFWVFLFISFTSAMLFFQIFTTLPLFHHEHFDLSEFKTGLLISLNGILVFMFEMPLVSLLERKQINRIKIIFFGSFLMAISFYILLMDAWAGILVIGIIIVTFGEIFSFPFSNAFAMGRAPKGQEGRYMALYTMSFSLAHIVSSKLGLEIIGHYGYGTNWFVMGSFGIVAMLFCVWLQRLLRAEKE
ncbi:MULTISPECIES: MDR family MFS transporter [unclassified Flavobacterium]|jgi:predicted MFS family arabinose efflux permease|uniref:MDR family MFS transporter n=1 Tax=unclassified Flavobacterium TaxID=196869 RepID=UPI0025BDBBED|nr:MULTISPECIES: MFS transporter [unclassified Flavobacterium]